MNAPLENLHIVITRPKHQADHICAELETAGATVSRLPVIEITPPKKAHEAQNLMELTAGYDTVIFISSNAVNYAFQLGGNDFKTRLSKCRIGAIGQKTALTLTAHGFNADVFPKQGFTSEDFLALPAMQAEQLANTSVLIVRGEGGRELLADTLTKRGATVDYLEVYRRICPSPDTILPLIQRQVQLPVDIIAVTSSEGLYNLSRLLQKTKWLKTTPLLLGSKRVAEDAISAGFTAPLLIATDPGDRSMQKALLQWRQEIQYDRQTR